MRDKEVDKAYRARKKERDSLRIVGGPNERDQSVRTDKYLIESGVPVPKGIYRTTLKYPWPDMHKGDRVLIPINSPEGPTKKSVNIIRTSVGKWLKRNRPGWQAYVEKTETGAMVWILTDEQLMEATK